MLHNGFPLKRILAGACVTALACAGLIGTGGAGGRGQVGASTTGIDGRTLSLSLDADLVTRAVTVSWAGFRPTRKVSGQYAVNIVQCKGTPTALDTDCFMNTRFPNAAQGSIFYGATTKADGAGSANFEIRGAMDLPAFGCSVNVSCSVLAYELTGDATPPGQMPSAYAYATILFAPSPADCPAVQDFDVRLGGEPSAAPLLYGLAGSACLAANPLIYDVTETSSNEGREALFEGQIDAGITDVPATPAEIAAHPLVTRIKYAPLDLTAVAVVFLMKDSRTGVPITSMVLSPRLVARVISDTGLDSFFADPEFLALNPTIGEKVYWPAAGLTRPLLRAEANADTALVTNWLNSNQSTRAFLDGNDIHGLDVSSSWLNVPYPTDIFESRAAGSGYIPLTTQRPVGVRMFYGVNPSGIIVQPDFQGVIGIVDLPTARRYGMATASIVNAAGAAVAPTTESILAGYSAMTLNSDGTRVANPYTMNPAAYPLVKVDHAMVTNALNPSRAAALKGLLDQTVGSVQDALPFGYVSLPQEARTQTTKIAAELAVLISGQEDAIEPEQSLDPPREQAIPNSGSSIGDQPLIVSSPATEKATTKTVFRGTARFTPVVAFPAERSPSMLMGLFLLGIAAGLGALAPIPWRRVKLRSKLRASA